MNASVTASREVQGMVDALASQLGRSVVIDDPAVRLVYTSRHFGDEDDVRIRAVLQRDAGADVGRFILSQGAARSHKPHTIPGNDELGLKARLCVPLYGPGWLMGLLMVIDADRTLTTAEIQHIESTSRDIATQMYADSIASEPRLLERQKHLRELLGRDGSARPSAVAFFEEDGSLQDADHAAVTVVAIDSRTELDAPVDMALRVALDNVVRGRSHTTDRFVDGNRAVLLQFSAKPWDSSQLLAQAKRIRTELGRLLVASNTVTAGIGSSTGGSTEAWLARRRSEIALRGATRLPGVRDGISCWDDLGVDAVLLELHDDSLVWTTIPEPLRHLVEQDGTGKLLETLRCFLDHGGSISRTAEALHMHRTSLYYRLDQIRSFTGLDLDDGKDRLALHVGVHLLDMVHRPTD